jgi:hypothetical protein
MNGNDDPSMASNRCMIGRGSMTDEIAKRVLARAKTGMPTVYEMKDRIKWGFGTGREDAKMHLQTLDTAHLGKNAIKVWLEDMGKRVFEEAVVPDEKKARNQAKAAIERLREELQGDRETVESTWVKTMIGNDWIKAVVKGRKVVLTVYPRHQSYTVEIDVGAMYPGWFTAVDPMILTTENLGFDASTGMLVLNKDTPRLDRRTILLRDHIWHGTPPE